MITISSNKHQRASSLSNCCRCAHLRFHSLVSLKTCVTLQCTLWLVLLLPLLINEKTWVLSVGIIVTKLICLGPVITIKSVRMLTFSSLSLVTIEIGSLAWVLNTQMPPRLHQVLFFLTSLRPDKYSTVQLELPSLLPKSFSWLENQITGLKINLYYHCQSAMICRDD